jgi:hypothetical protein
MSPNGDIWMSSAIADMSGTCLRALLKRAKRGKKRLGNLSLVIVDFGFEWTQMPHPELRGGDNIPLS